MHVVRAFRDEAIAHPSGSIDPARDVQAMEDELILALPVVPLAPGSEPLEQEWSPPEEEAAKAGPFAALAALKKKD